MRLYFFIDVIASSYASVPANNNMQLRLGARFHTFAVFSLAPSLDFRLLFAGTEA